jgi:hypothetical protein
VVDSGRSGVKVLYPQDETKFLFPAVIAQGHEFSMPVAENDPLKALHVVIANLGEFFVGEMAVRQNRAATQVRDRDKSNLNNVVSIITAASLFANEGDTMQVVTNCPARDWAKQKAALAARLTGSYRVQHKRGFLAGVQHGFQVEAKVLPEGAAAFFGALYDWRNLQAVRPKLADGVTLVVDVGDTTANYVTMQDQDYQDEMCGTVDFGLHRANAQILTRLQAECDGAEVSLPELDAILQKPEPIYRHGRKEINLSAWRSESYSALAKRIASELQARLSGVPNHVLLVGGGGVALTEYLRDRFAASEVLCPLDAAWLNAYGMAVMMGLAGNAA